MVSIFQILSKRNRNDRGLLQQMQYHVFCEVFRVSLSSRRSRSRLVAAHRGTMIALPKLVLISHVSPWLVAATFVAMSIAVWMLSYIFEWLQELDFGAGNGSLPFLEDPTSLEKVQCPSLFNPPEKYLSLVIPAYNEEKRLSDALEETLRYLQIRAAEDNAFTYEIIIVDDGSNDNTVKVAFEYVRKFKIETIRVVKLGTNHGKGAAVRKGMLCSRGMLLLMLDADGATKITDLEKLEIAILEYSRSCRESISEVPVVACGSRAHLEKQALATRKWYRNIMMRGFHICVLLAAGPVLKDTQCGFKMFTRSAARQLFVNLRLKRWCFDVEMIYLCRRLKIPVVEIAVNWTEIPGSKLRISSIFHMLFELALLRLGYGFRIWRIHQSFLQS